MLTNNFRDLNFHVANEKAQHALKMASFFFFFFWALGKVLRGDFFVVPNMILSSSSRVLQDVPNRYHIFIAYDLPKVVLLSHVWHSISQ